MTVSRICRGACLSRVAVCVAGVGFAQLTERFNAEYWSPAPKKLLRQALANFNCQHCNEAPVLKQPKHVHWQHILAHGCVR